jgi:putative phosphoribosyl transferase
MEPQPLLQKHEQTVEVDTGTGVVMATLALPANSSASPHGEAHGIVCIVHGSGSSRHSVRNRAVAQDLMAQGIGVLLVNVLTEDEAKRLAERKPFTFTIRQLADRAAGTVSWLARHPATAHAPVGMFGSSTGAAGALFAAARHPVRVRAVVSRGGRTDLAAPDLPNVRVPVLLLVGEHDMPIRRVTQQTRPHLAGPSQVDVVAKATHLFEEPGAMEDVSRRTVRWFQQHLMPPDSSAHVPSGRHES